MVGVEAGAVFCNQRPLQLSVAKHIDVDARHKGGASVENFVDVAPHWRSPIMPTPSVGRYAVEKTFELRARVGETVQIVV